MKLLLRILPLFAALFLLSCTKEEVSPTTPGGTSTVQVEYRVYAASSDVTIYAFLPSIGVPALSEQKINVNRMNYSKVFNVTSGTEVSIRASNRNPGAEEVIAEIYVNGQLLVSASANAPGHTAVAAGIAQ